MIKSTNWSRYVWIKQHNISSKENRSDFIIFRSFLIKSDLKRPRRHEMRTFCLQWRYCLAEYLITKNLPLMWFLFRFTISGATSLVIQRNVSPSYLIPYLYRNIASLFIMAVILSNGVNFNFKVMLISVVTAQVELGDHYNVASMAKGSVQWGA